MYVFGEFGLQPKPTKDEAFTAYLDYVVNVLNHAVPDQVTLYTLKPQIVSEQDKQVVAQRVEQVLLSRLDARYSPDKTIPSTLPARARAQLAEAVNAACRAYTPTAHVVAEEHVFLRNELAREFHYTRG